MAACENSEIPTNYCFTSVSKPIISEKGLRYRDDILDNMESTELSTNLFRISQTEEKLKKDNIQTEQDACNTHNKIGKIVRNAIKQAGRNNARRFTYN